MVSNKGAAIVILYGKIAQRDLPLRKQPLMNADERELRKSISVY
jgi:hypothetical protein